MAEKKVVILDSGAPVAERLREVKVGDTTGIDVKLQAATGDEVAVNIQYEVDKAAGNDTGLVVNQTDTSSPGTSLLADFQVGGVSKASIDNTGLAALGAGSTVGGVDIVTASSTDTLTNKTFDANGTGNSLSNVDVADLADGTDGELITWSATGAPETVAVGTATQVLTSNGIGAAPTFEDASGGASPLTTKGDLYGFSTVDARLAVGTDDWVLTADATQPLGIKWAAAGGGGFTSIVDDETNGNYAIGLNALNSVTVGSGLDNIAIGENAGTTLATGDRNVAIGTDALKSLVAVGNNVVIGYQAMDQATGATSNVVIGYQAAGSLGGGDNNTLIGQTSGNSLTTGSKNLGLGNQVNPASTGDFNIAIGNAAANDNLSDNNQIVINNHFNTVAVPVLNGYQGAQTDVDMSGKDLTLTGPSARISATTNLDGGDMVVQGGQAATTGIGVGGNLYLKGGTKGATGTTGLVMMDNLPTSDPSVAGALWNNSSVLTISAG